MKNYFISLCVTWFLAGALRLFKRAQRIGEIIKKADEIHVVSHIDADGLTAGAIAFQTLRRMGKECSIEFIKQLDEENLDRLKNENHELVWFTDLGSNIAHSSPGLKKIITDHHLCPLNEDNVFHLNPHIFNIDGGSEISGAGVTYLVSKSIDKKNMDLSTLAVVGANGDLQDRKHGRLWGLNREILRDGNQLGLIQTQVDIRYFGRETRPVHKLLQYANDPLIPGLTGCENACVNFIREKGVNLKQGDVWRKWIDLKHEEKRKIVSGIAQLLLNKGFGHETVKRVIGEIYVLKREKKGTMLHDAKEYATLLNSTARYGQHEVGLRICLGDRDKWYKKALNLLRGHRQNLVRGMQIAKEEGIYKKEKLQFFHSGNGIRDTVVGIVVNMLLNSQEVDNSLPLLGFAYKNEKEVKASARCTQTLVEKGLDLSAALRNAASKVGGIGGGHNIAAGATIPRGKEEEFLEQVEKELKKQMT